MILFDCLDYREYISFKLKAEIKLKKGGSASLARALGVNSSYVSQVIQGHKNLSSEQAYLLSEHFGFDTLECDYFAALTSYSRASNPNYKAHLTTQLMEMRRFARMREGLSTEDQPLDLPSQGIFYSSWWYAAIHLLTGIKEFKTSQNISRHLGISVADTEKVLDFLVTRGLCKFTGSTYSVGLRSTHLHKDSPFRPRHHLNWRMKSIEHMPKADPQNFFFTAPMRIDEKTFSKIKIALETFCESQKEKVDLADDELVACLNIDLFKV